MGDPEALRIWGGRGAYLLIACAIVFLRLLPLEIVPPDFGAEGSPLGGQSVLARLFARLPTPDVLYAVTLAWVLRRPEHVPPLLVALVVLSVDMIFLRPPGLWALLVVLSAEFLRARQHPQVDFPFPFEWLLVSSVMVATALLENLILAVFLVARPPLGVALQHSLVTLLLYPAVVAALHFGLRLKRAAPAELEAMRRRL